MLAKGMSMKLFSIALIFLIYCQLTFANCRYTDGLEAEKILLTKIDIGTVISLLWDFPRSRDSDQYFQIGNCRFPADDDLTNMMMENWPKYKGPAGLAMTVDKEQFLRSREKIKSQFPSYLAEVSCCPAGASSY
jgi:hypothetical protein